MSVDSHGRSLADPLRPLKIDFKPRTWPSPQRGGLPSVEDSTRTVGGVYERGGARSSGAFAQLGSSDGPLRGRETRVRYAGYGPLIHVEQRIMGPLEGAYHEGSAS